MELQGVSLVALSYFRDQEAARKLADTVAEHGGIIGACVCCAEIGGPPPLPLLPSLAFIPCLLSDSNDLSAYLNH